MRCDLLALVMRPSSACAILFTVATVTFASAAETQLPVSPNPANNLINSDNQTVNEEKKDLAERLAAELSKFHLATELHDAFLAAAKHAVAWAKVYNDITSETVPFEEFLNGDDLKVRHVTFEAAMLYGALYSAIETQDYTMEYECLCVLSHVRSKNKSLVYDSHGTKLQPIALLANRDYYISYDIVNSVAFAIKSETLLSDTILLDITMNLVSQYIETGWRAHAKCIDYWLEYSAEIKVSVSMLLQLIQALNTKQWPINNDSLVCNDNTFDDNVRTRLETVIRRLVHAAPSGMVEAMRATTLYEKSADYLIAHSLHQIHELKRKRQVLYSDASNKSSIETLGNTKTHDVSQPNDTEEPTLKKQKRIRSRAITIISSLTSSLSEEFCDVIEDDN